MLSKAPLEHQIKDIYREHYRDVYHFLIYFTGNQSEAEDLTQEVFIQVLKALPRFNHQSQLKTWILSIAKHVAIDRYRRKKIMTFFDRKQAIELHTIDGIPEKTVEEKEVQQELYEALLKLKPKYRSVIILRGLKEYSVRETADILDWTESKVKTTYHRGLKRLKDQLEPGIRGGELSEQA